MPDMQQMRNYAPMLILQARVAIAEGNLTGVAHRLEIGFAVSRQVGERPFLVKSSVAIALVSQFIGTVTDFVK
jgi:hypothetical protein